MKNSFKSDLRAKRYDGARTAKLGTEHNPAKVSVQTEKRKKEVTQIFQENSWSFEIDINPDNPENIKDLNMLQNPGQTVKNETKVGRNAPCPCGSGKKHKKCCG